MDNTPLNAAHYQHRRAEASMKFRHYEDAITSHEKAIEHLQDALKMTTSLKAIDSLSLQCEYHKKQIDLTKFKRDQFENYKKNIEKQKLKMEKHYGSDFTKDVYSENLPAAINKTLDEADSILELLFKRNVKNGMDSLCDQDSIDNHVVQCHNIGENLIVSGVKEPKNEDVVIEELQIVNQQLRRFINELLTQLDEKKIEVKTLKNKVSYLENENNRLLGQQNNLSSSPQIVNHNTPLGIITDSTGENSSPFVFSPCSELSPGALNDDRELPALPPLEMPDFDFDSLVNIRQPTQDPSKDLAKD